MTTIIAMRSGGGVILGSDSRVMICGAICQSTTHSKVYVRQSGASTVTLAVAGSVRLSNLVRGCPIPATLGKAKDLHGWVIDEFVPAISAHLGAAGYPADADKEEAGSDEMLVVIGDRFWRVASDWSVFEPGDTFTAIGSGECYVLGALHALAAAHPELPDRNKVAAALAAAAAFDYGTGGTMSIIGGDA